MTALIDIALTASGLVLLAPAAWLATEVLAAMLPARPRADPSPSTTQRPSISVLIPAHNEEAGIAATLDNLRRQLTPADRILVVADNCDDETAGVARQHGTEVVERQDPARRGKGHALDFGLRHLAQNPPDVVMIIDADCLAEPDAIETLAGAAAIHNGPVQGRYLMEIEPDAVLAVKLAAFAFTVKNLVRPLGLGRLSLPCPLTGTGMAFPWPVIRAASLATGHIVEDMKLGLDLAITGHPTTFERRAGFSSRFAATPEGQGSQRRRWEHGHLSLIADAVPRLIYQGARQGRPSLLALALDLAIPPLSLLTLLLVVALLASAILAAVSGALLPLTISAVATGLAAFGLIGAWAGFGRSIVMGRELLSIPFYVMRKLPIYLGFIRRREQQWVRTPRSDENVRR